MLISRRRWKRCSIYCFSNSSALQDDLQGGFLAGISIVAMNLKEILKEHRSSLVKEWFETVLDSYEEGSRGPLRRRDAQFANPVGYNLAEGLGGLFDGLLAGVMPGDVATFLDSIIRIRAIQDFTPSRAVAFIFELKRIIRRQLGQERLQQGGISQELATFEAAVDDLALYAFDLYVQCREKIYDLKAREATNATFRLLQKAKLIAE